VNQVMTSVDQIIDRQNSAFSCLNTEPGSNPRAKHCPLQYRMMPEGGNPLAPASANTSAKANASDNFSVNTNANTSANLAEKRDPGNVVWNGLTFPVEQRHYIDQFSEFLADYTQKVRQEVAQTTLQLQEELASCKRQLVLSQQAEHQTRKKNLELNRISRLDGLTQIANRRHFDEQLQFEWRRLTRSQKPLSLVLCDVDYFKRYNDTYGHQMGDFCLKQVAQAMRKTARRAGDFVARYGGEEFVFLLPNTDADAAIEFAERLQASIQKMQLPHRDSAVSSMVTLSMGICTLIPGKTTSPDALFVAADKALYEAKNMGRDRIVAI
jgi:diguanylate cyclase (GGDEF)-like protein